jgi:hypothetical protein
MLGRLIGVLAACVLGLMSLPAAAPGATTIGKTQTDTGSCSTGDNLVQGVSSSPSYAIPAGGGVITRWTHAGRAAASAGQGKLLVWRPTGDPSQFTLVGKSSSQVFTPSSRVTYPTRIPVRGGDVLGMRIESSAVACWIAFQADGMRKYNGSEPPEGANQTFGAENSTQQVNVEATLEPDADGDGFGDESQDGCPGQSGTEAGCPPAVDPGPTDPDPVDPGPAGDIPASEGTPPDNLGSAKIGAGSIVDKKKIDVENEPPSIRLVPDCPNGRLGGEIGISRLDEAGGQVAGGKPVDFTCRDGKAAFDESSGFFRLKRDWWKEAHTDEGLVVVATINVNGSEPPISQPVWLLDKDAPTPRTPKATWQGIGSSCHGFQNFRYMTLGVPAGYGFQDQPLQWHTAVGQAQTYDGRFSGWLFSNSLRYQLHGNGQTVGGFFVFGGGLGVGGAQNLLWNGNNHYYVPAGGWARIHMWIHTARNGWVGAWIYPSDVLGARTSNEWCGF